jgi:hypothetical protein
MDRSQSITIETMLTMPKLPRFLFVLLAGGGFALTAIAAGASPALPDFSGIWRLNDQQSDSPDQIAARLRTERKREEAAAQLPASASSSSTPVTSSASNNHGSHGGGHGMGGGMGGGSGGGHGRGGNRDQSKAGSSDGVSPIVDTPPPLLANDAILNVQQDSKHLQVALSDSDQLNARLDGIAQQSLNGSAVIQTRTYTDGLSISMQFDGGTHLEEYWVRSADGHHLTVTEQWTTPTARQPIVFKRSYDRLDI